TLTATVVSPAARTNTATISAADQFDPSAANNTASATATPQRADLQVSKAVSDATPNVGDTVTFTITLTDKGPDAATNRQVPDLRPRGLTLIAASPSQGNYNSTTGIWTVGTVTTTAAQTLTLTARVDSPNPLTNTATVSRADQFDPVTANNSAAATGSPQQADVDLTKTVRDPRPNDGDTVTVTVTLTTQRPNTAANATGA